MRYRTEAAVHAGPSVSEKARRYGALFISGELRGLQTLQLSSSERLSALRGLQWLGRTEANPRAISEDDTDLDELERQAEGVNFTVYQGE